MEDKGGVRVLSTESTIVIRARKALKDKTGIDIQVPDWVDSVRFIYLDGTESGSFEEWFSACIERNIKDIKISRYREETDPVRYQVENDSIVCIWDDKVTKFDLRGTRKEEKYCMEFYESAYEGDVTELYEISDGVEDYKKNLLELKELADKMKGCSYFADRFFTAYRILNGETKPDHKKSPYYLREMPDRMKDIMLARSASYVFGGMGSWNDDPAGLAEEMGLGDDYNRLTHELEVNMRKAEFYVANMCFETK